MGVLTRFPYKLHTFVAGSMRILFSLQCLMTVLTGSLPVCYARYGEPVGSIRMHLD